MSNHFSRLRVKRWLFSTLLAVILYGIGVGVVTFSGVIIAAKLQAGSGLRYYLIAVGIALAAGVVMSLLASLLASPVFLLAHLPPKKRFAKHLDETYDLKEKARTMVALEGQTDTFAEVQRMDAEMHISEIKFSLWNIKQLIAFILVLTISLTALLTALVVPARSGAGAGPNEDPVTEFDKQRILIELSNIKSTVEKSLITDSLKADTVTEIASLIAFVETHEYLSEMKIEATKSVIKIDDALDGENTAIPIAERLQACNNQTLTELGAELAKLSDSGVRKKLDQLADELSGGDKTEASYVADELAAAITAAGTDNTSPFTTMMRNLVSALHGYASGSVSSIDAAFATVKADDALVTRVMMQNLNQMIVETAKTRICTLFGITVEDLVASGADSDINIEPPTVETPPDEGEDDKNDWENEEIGSGGIGTGDRIYGSNDMIYNPYTNEYVPYGQVYDEYNNRVLQMVEDGRIPQDFEDFIKEYFRSLSEYKPAE